MSFKDIGDALLFRATTLLSEWLPGGRTVGTEYVCADINGGHGTSFSVNIKTGRWCDFASPDIKGGDLVSLYAKKNALSQGEAARELSTRFGLLSTPHRPPAVVHTKPEPVLITPPEDAPPPSLQHYKYGAPTDHYVYRTATGTPLFYIARYDPPGERKQIIPWSYSDQGRWIAKAHPERPLYNLDHLTRDTSRPVLIVEGEKAARAAEQLLGHAYTITTWSGGGMAFGKTDLAPLHGRRLVLWPDADEPGLKAMEQLRELLEPQALEIKTIIPKDKPDGWDAADALESGMTTPQVVAWARSHITKPKPPEPEPASTDNPLFVPDSMRYEQHKSPAQHSLVFEKYLRDKLLFDETSQSWYLFDTVWKLVTVGDAERVIMRLLDINYEKYTAAWQKNLTSAIKLKLGRSPLNNRTHSGVADTWNTRRELFPMKNGVLNLETGTLHPHHPDLMMNWLVPYDYDPNAQCPTIHHFMENLAQGNPEAMELAFAYLWAILFGRADLQRYLEFIGLPGTGKSTYIQIATNLVGPENAVVTTMRQLSENRFETSNLFAKRLAIISDADRWAGSLDIFKAITGQDPIRFEQKNKQQSRPFVFGGMVLIAGNTPIQSNEQSTALVRRRLSIHLDKAFPDDRRDPNLLFKLSSEMPGLVNWLMRMDREACESLLRRTKSRRSLVETDVVALWINECLILDANAQTNLGLKEYDKQLNLKDPHLLLYPNFIEYTEQRQLYGKVSHNTFSSRVIEIFKTTGHAVKKGRNLHGVTIDGVRLRKNADALLPCPIDGTFLHDDPGM